MLMLKKCFLRFCVFVLAWLVLYGLTPSVEGQFHAKNNIIGVHQISPSEKDIRDGCRLVNANGGAWGWQTIVLREGEYSVESLQKFHDIAREEKCILIHRLATSFGDGGVWNRPSESTINHFADLLSKVNTSTKYKYVVWLNEPNHASEFGGGCDPAAYGNSAVAAAKALKEKDPHIIFMLAGLDLAAPESRPAFCDAGRFYQEMIAHVSGVYDQVDALASHCYPASFNGSATASGRRSILCYQWEKSLLQSLGVGKAANFKVFITESGWQHGDDNPSLEHAATNLDIALRRWQQSSDIMAVTYFAYKFLTPPFNSFSVVSEHNINNNVGFALSGIPKVAGEPEHIHKSTCTASFPKDVVENVPFILDLACTNIGTDIWNALTDGYKLFLQSPFQYSCSDFHVVKPQNKLRTICRINPGKTTGCSMLNVTMSRNNALLMNMFSADLCVNPPPVVQLTQIRRFPGATVDDGEAEVQVLKENNEELVYREKFSIEKGVISIPAVEGVNFDQTYRIVVLKQGSLPVQVVKVHFAKGTNQFETPMFLPIDLNGDGKFSLSDLISGFSH